MGKGSNEPVTDTHTGTLNDVYDAENPEQIYSKANGSLHAEKVHEEVDIRELSPDHKIALEKQRQRREKEPLLYCKLITKWPLQSFLLTLSGHILMIVISAGLIASGYDLLPIDFQNLPLQLNDLPWRKRDLAWSFRDQYANRYDRTPVAGSYRSMSYPRANIELYYDAGGGNIFTKANLQKIQSIENTLTSVSGYTNYCQLSPGSNICADPISIVRFFDGTLASVDPVFNDPSFNNIPVVLHTALTNNATKSDFQFFLGRSYSITNTSAYSSITRSIVPLGYPLQGYSTAEDYETDVKEFTASNFYSVLDDIRSSSGDFDFTYRSQLLWFDVVFKQAMSDVLCAVGSIMFIFVFILVHTKSLWITGFAVLSIMTSFLCTNLIYRVVLDFRYIGFFHVLTIFIVLGIGADDIFVFYDVWRNTGHEDYPTLAHRLSDAYRKSVFSMLFTSITTAAAFFANAISPLLATRSFGVFSGIVIIVNYLSVIIYFPTVVVMYHVKFQKFKWPCVVFCKRKCKQCCSCCDKTQDSTVSPDLKPAVYEADTIPTHSKHDAVLKSKFIHPRPKPLIKTPTVISITPLVDNDTLDTESSEGRPENKNTENKMLTRNSSSKSFKDSKIYPYEKTGVDNLGFVGDGDVKTDAKQIEGNREKVERYGVAKQRKKKGIFVRFFRDKYFKFVTHPIIRWFILLLMAAVLAFFIYQATRLEPDNEGLKVLKPTHVLRIAADHALESFVESDADTRLILFISWGMLERDLSGCHFSTPDCRGEQVWDTSFNPSTPEAQLAMKALCDRMLSFTTEETNGFHIRRDYTTDIPQVNCYMSNLADFLDAESTSTGGDWSLTYDYSKTVDFMDNRTDFYNSSSFTSDYKHFLEVPISYWLSNKYTYSYTDDFYLFDHLIGEEIGSYSSPMLNDTTKYYGNNIKYVSIQVNTTIKYQTLGYVEGIPIMNKWEEFVTSEMAKMPAGMEKGFQSTRFIWHWLLVQEALANNAIYGIALGVSLAFPILVIATRNILTGFLATLSMASSTVCVIGVITLGGWKLGVLVSLNMCMVVGLTVDYVVHLAEGYTLSLHHDRLSRVKDMLDEMAVSVFFGACTTLGASLFMFIAQLSFFFQFGIFMFSTIGFSLFFSMGMFVTLMGICGPQGETGNIVVMVKKLHKWCKSKCKGNKTTAA